MVNPLYRKAILLGLGFGGISAILALYNNFVPIFLAQLGLSAAWVGFVMTWDNYFALFIQPIAGSLSDRTQNRLGRRKPWLLAGAPLAALCFMAIPAFPGLAVVMVAILLTNLGLALFRVPAVALLGDVFPPEQRSQANGVINFMGGIGAVIAFIAGGMLYSAERGVLQPIQRPFIFGGLLLLFAIVIVLRWVKEPEHTDPAEASGSLAKPGLLSQISRLSPAGLRSWRDHRHRPTLWLLAALACSALGSDTVQTWLSSFGKFTLGIEPGKMAAMLGYGFVLPSLLAAIPAGLLGARFGRRRMVLIGFSAMALLFTGGWFVSNQTDLTGLLVLTGVASALISVNALPLVYDLSGSEANLGELTGLYYLSTNIAAIVGPPVAGLLIDLSGKNYRVAFMVGALAMALAALLAARIVARG